MKEWGGQKERVDEWMGKDGAQVKGHKERWD